MTLESDRALLDGFRQGRRWALERVYALYVDDVARYLRKGFSFESGGSAIRFAGAPSEFHLEDWVHDVFMRAFTDAARSQYDGIRPYGPYLHRIARNLVIDELRRKEHQLRAHVEELPEPQAAAEYAADVPLSPEMQAERRQLDEHVRAYASNLPPRERQVYQLRFVEGLDQKEVAARSGLSASKIKTSERRIRDGFYTYLSRLGWLDESAPAKDAEAREEVGHV